LGWSFLHVPVLFFGLFVLVSLFLVPWCWLSGLFFGSDPY
jgi:hypothetical protein